MWGLVGEGRYHWPPDLLPDTQICSLPRASPITLQQWKARAPQHPGACQAPALGQWGPGSAESKPPSPVSLQPRSETGRQLPCTLEPQNQAPGFFAFGVRILWVSLEQWLCG